MGSCDQPSDLPSYDPKILLNSQPVIVSVIDPTTHRVQFQNETGLKQFGDISGFSCYEKIASCSSPCEFCRMPEALETGTIVSNEVPLPGNKFLLVHWSKATTTDGRTHVVETIADITEHKHTAQALHQSQKMEAVGRLAGGIAHDFNNLMMVVIGHSQRLLERPALHPARQDLELISQAGVRAAALTKKLLTFSRRQVLEAKDLSINTAIRDMECLLKRLIGEEVQSVITLNPQTGHAFVDPVQFEQVIINLALNARDSMPNGGLMSIETDNAELDETFCGSHPGSTPGPHVRITVHDTGCGMDSDTIGHIFEPFFTTKGPGKGTGLGLATVYGIVKQSKGYIEVWSEPGRGSRFTVYLPRVEPPVIEPQSTDPANTTDQAVQDTILLVEDDEAILGLITTILEEHGYHVQATADGIEAIQRLQMLHGVRLLIITDVIVPRMTTGVFAEKITATRPEAKILFVSDYAAEILQANGITEGTPFLQKPFLPNQLVEKVRELLPPRRL